MQERARMTLVNGATTRIVTPPVPAHDRQPPLSQPDDSTMRLVHTDHSSSCSLAIMRPLSHSLETRTRAPLRSHE